MRQGGARWHSDSGGDLLSLVERERSRWQRYHISSCLVLFDLSKATRPDKMERALFRGLSRRVRAADSIGRLGEERIGLLLPATGLNGAGKVVRDVLGSWRREEVPRCTVQCYPEKDAVVLEELPAE